MCNNFQYLKFPVLFFLISLVWSYQDVFSQEFDCDITVNSRQISGSSYEYIGELEDELESYINNTRWTEDRYQEHERIKCQFQIVLTSVDDQFNYSAEILINVRRPIYNSNQESSALILTDNTWAFSYPRNKNLVRDLLQFDGLTSFIDFYVFVILGFDYDTFEELGGSEHFRQAQTIFELGQNSGVQGWGRSIGSQRNRFGLINDLMNPSYQDLRKANYRYHRHGLDLFTLNSETAIDEVLEALENIRDTKRVASNNYLFDIFFDSKHQEITALLRTATIQKRLEAYNLLRDVDPAHSTVYEALQN